MQSRAHRTLESNFRASSAEQVALVDPDGTVIVSHFAPQLIAPEPVPAGDAEDEDDLDAGDR